MRRPSLYPLEMSAINKQTTFTAQPTSVPPTFTAIEMGNGVIAVALVMGGTRSRLLFVDVCVAMVINAFVSPAERASSKDCRSVTDLRQGTHLNEERECSPRSRGCLSSAFMTLSNSKDIRHGIHFGSDTHQCSQGTSSSPG